jgi:hypothetical protein
MKALSLWQPWASAVVLGRKELETRSWMTPHRGPLLIHAAQGVPASVRRSPEFAVLLARLGVKSIGELPLGGIVGRVDLVNCLQIIDDMHIAAGNAECWGCTTAPEEPELGWGDYTPGRYAWVMTNPIALPFRRERGRQQLFNVAEAQP